MHIGTKSWRQTPGEHGRFATQMGGKAMISDFQVNVVTMKPCVRNSHCLPEW